MLTSLRKDRAIERITVATIADIDVNGRQVRMVAAAAIRGPALISVVDGRLPSGDREIMLGAATMRSVGAQPGGLVQVTVTDPEGAPHKAQFRVVGRASFPPGFGTGGLGTGAAMTSSALTDTQCPPGAGGSPASATRSGAPSITVLARAAPGPAAAAALARHVSTYRQFTGAAQEPVELVNFGESVNFPLLFGAMLALFGAATMVHLLLVSVSRRRAEAGLLKVLGFVRYQVAAVVSWQATAVALVGIAAGVPLGIAAGQVVWRVFATNFGVVPLTVVEALPWPRSPSGCSPPPTFSPSSLRCWPRDHALPSYCGPSEGHPHIVGACRDDARVDAQSRLQDVPAGRWLRLPIPATDAEPWVTTYC